MSRKRIGLGFTLCSLFALGLGIANISADPLVTHASVAPSSVIEATCGTVTENLSVPVSVKDCFSKADDNRDRKGLLLSSETEGAIFTISEPIVGNFEVDFRVYSENTFGYYGESFNAETFSDETNKSLDLRSVTFRLTDEETQTAIYVRIDGGASWAPSVPSAKVGMSGQGPFVARWYNSGKLSTWDESGTEPVYDSLNSSDYFTNFWGTSFSNKGGSQTNYLKDEGNVHSCVIGFDVETMEIYTRYYGYAAENIHDIPIVDLDEDASRLGFENNASFSSYTVDIIFSDITDGRTANMLLYSLNGQDLAGAGSFSSPNTSTPSVSVKPMFNVAVGERYYIDEPKGYDLYDGTFIFNGEVESVTLDGEELPVYKDGAEQDLPTAYSSGLYVIPQKTGNCEVHFTGVTNSAGTSSVSGCTGTVQVVDIKPGVTFTTTLGFEEGINYQISKGKSVNVGGIARSNLLRDENTVSELFLTLKKDGTTVAGYDGKKITEEEWIDFSQEGEYTVEYKAALNTQENHTYEVYFSVLPLTLSLRNDVSQSAVYTLGESVLVEKSDVVVSSDHTYDVDAVVVEVSFNDGEYVPIADTIFNQAGKYEVRYTATLDGKSCTVIRTIYVIEKTSSSLTLTWQDDPGVVKIDDGTYRGKVGQAIALPIAVATSGTETLTVSRKVFDGSGAEISVDGEFVPMQTGKYTVVYMVDEDGVFLSEAVEIIVKKHWIAFEEKIDFTAQGKLSLFDLLIVKDLNGNVIDDAVKNVELYKNGNRITLPQNGEQLSAGVYKIVCTAEYDGEISPVFEKEFTLLSGGELSLHIQGNQSYTKLCYTSFSLPQAEYTEDAELSFFLERNGERTEIRGHEITFREPGEYKVIYRVEDIDGAAVEKSFTVKVISIAVIIVPVSVVVLGVAAGIVIGVVLKKKKKKSN